MSLATTIDSPEFIAHLAGLYRDAERLALSAHTILRGAAQRVDAIRRNGYLRLAEIGDALLTVQAERPDEFDAWFAAHTSELGFSRRTAYRCKAAARLIQEHGIEEAITLALGGADRDRPAPFYSLCLRTAPGEVPAGEIAAVLDRIRPVVEFYHTLEARASSL